jgi:predicted nucleic acid-binding protein
VRGAPELFAESSALVAWLLWEGDGPRVMPYLRAARVSWLSAVAAPECRRALLRAKAQGRVDARYVRRSISALDRFVEDSRVVLVDEDILDRAGDPFPVEPIRTLDAIHLASLERARQTSSRVILLSLDDRVRDNAMHLGIPVVP